MPVHHSTEPVFQPSFRPPSPALVLTPTTTPEIRRQPLNGTGILSAFYDSKCYQCNICKFKSVTRFVNHTFFFFSNNIFLYLVQQFFNIFLLIYFFVHIAHSIHIQIIVYVNIHLKNIILLFIMILSIQKLWIYFILHGVLMENLLYVWIHHHHHRCRRRHHHRPQQKMINQLFQQQQVISQNLNEKLQGKKTPKQKKEDDDDDIVILSEKHDINPRPSSSIAKRPTHKEKQTHTYVLMKHRRCYSIKNPPCFHSLTLEYNICREHTIRHMCQTQGILKRLRLKPKLDRLSSIDEVAKCLKTIVNNILDLEEKRLEIIEFFCVIKREMVF